MTRATNSTIERLRVAALGLRAAIEAFDFSQWEDDALSKYPWRCCSHAASLLALHLDRLGWDGLQKAEGRRHFLPLYQHVWLQGGDIILDITGDPFGEGLGPVVVTDHSPWHAAWKPWLEPLSKEPLNWWRPNTNYIYNY